MRKGNSGKPGINLTPLRDTVRTISLKCRTTLRGLGFALAIPKSTLHDHLKKLGLRNVPRYLKSILTNENKIRRVELAKRWVRPSAGGGHKFHHFEDFARLNKRWFNLLPKRAEILHLRRRGCPCAKGEVQVAHSESDVPCCGCAAAVQSQRQPHIHREDRGLPVHRSEAGTAQQQEQGSRDNGDQIRGG